MAAFVRSALCQLSTERSAFLTKTNTIIVESKRLVRGLRRKPVRVLFPENDSSRVVNSHQQPKEKATRITSKTQNIERNDAVKKKITEQSSGKRPQVAVTRDQVDGLRFERAFPGDKRLSRLVSVARSRTFREHQGKILLEGRRLICDALEANASPQMVFFSTVERLQELPLDKLRRATLVKVKFQDIKIWSDLVAPQGVIAIFSRPNPERLNFSQRGQSVPLSLICDNIRDPGNLGTMLRCAAAAGCHRVLLTIGCVDAWEPKVLRAAMGAHFRLPIYPNLDWDDVKNHLPKPVTVHVADSGPNISAETGGNGSHKPSKPGDFGWVSSRPDGKNMSYQEYDSDSESDSDSDSDSEDEGPQLSRLETKLYHETWTQSPSALVIGGETHGLSVEAVQLAEETSGHRLFIPVVHDVDSLNSAMAASILLFEGRRQLLKLLQTSGKKLQSEPQRKFS
uniref:RNA methyltransferase like 1 n=1 Tax=Nothobranchius korthausae TaxID=1143690 RepID=A0A1A8F6Q0_9TELE